MAMEIIISAEVHDFGLPETNEVANTVIPKPPPLPASWIPHHCKLATADIESIQSDADSGHGGSILFICDAIPGLELSDSEFNQEFSSDSSAVSSRRGSADVASGFFVPEAPPPPPLPNYLTSHETEMEIILNQIEHSHKPAARVLRRHRSFDSYYSYESYPDSLYSYSQQIAQELIEEELSRPRGERIEQTCIVCYDTQNDYVSSARKCCSKYVCSACISAIVHTNLNEGIVFIACPNPDCDSGAIGRDEINSHISGALKNKFEKMRLEAEGSDTKKACPNCSHLTEHELPKRFQRYKVENRQITCTKCKHVWCFVCHAPWHEGLSCRQFRRGNAQFRKWTNERSRTGVANCQKCPLCRVYIQRSTGCDHMTCNRCDTHFCYKCGGRFVDIPGLGDHYEQTSILGCKYNYSKNKPAKRVAVRGGYFGAKMAALTGYPFLFVAGVVVVVVVGAVALPVYGGYRYYKYRKNMKRRYWRRRRN